MNSWEFDSDSPEVHFTTTFLRDVWWERARVRSWCKKHTVEIKLIRLRHNYNDEWASYLFKQRPSKTRVCRRIQNVDERVKNAAGQQSNVKLEAATASAVHTPLLEDSCVRHTHPHSIILETPNWEARLVISATGLEWKLFMASRSDHLESFKSDM